MLPNDGLEFDYEIIEHPSHTFNIDFDKGVIVGKIDGLEAVEQAIHLILSTKRYSYVIYSWNYGTELNNLIGEREELVVPESKRFIKESLLHDDRIIGVNNFEVTFKEGVLTISFKVDTIYGIIDVEEVEIDVR